MNVDQLIAGLNALTRGDLQAIRARIEESRRACLSLGHDELAARLDEAAQALGSGDLKTYRKRLETVVSRLGHLRARPEGPAD